MVGDSAEERAYYRTSRHVYNSWFATLYDTITAPFRSLRRRVARVAGTRSGMHVLDVATGTGAQARAFAATGASVLGIDLSARMLAIARRKSPSEIEFAEADATALPLPDASFDAACVSFALHEMPAGIRQKVVAELARVTRTGGNVVIVDYARPRNRVWDFLVEHVIAWFERDAYRDFLRSDLDGLLASSRMSVIEEHRALLGTAHIVVARREPPS